MDKKANRSKNSQKSKFSEMNDETFSKHTKYKNR